MGILCFLVIVLLVFVIQRAIYQAKWYEGVDAEVHFGTGQAVEGEQVELLEKVTHRGRLHLPWLLVKFSLSRELELPDAPNSRVTDYYNREDVFRISRGERITRTLPMRCTHRGVWRIKSVDMIGTDLFFCSKFIVNYDQTETITVFPRPIDIREIEECARRLSGDIVVTRSINEDPFIFKGVRDYVPGDQLKHINWRASAKTDKLSVNVFEKTSSLSMTVILNTQTQRFTSDTDRNEEAIRVAAAISSRMIARGVPLAFFTGARDIEQDGITAISHGCSGDHMDKINTALARLDLERDAEDFEQVVESAIGSLTSDDFVYVISSDISRQVEDAVLRLEEQSAGLLWVIPLLQDDDKAELERLDELRVRNKYVWRAYGA